MGYYVKTAAPCIDCGEPTEHRANHSRAPVCFECGIRRAAANMLKGANEKRRRIERDKRAARRRR